MAGKSKVARTATAMECVTLTQRVVLLIQLNVSHVAAAGDDVATAAAQHCRTRCVESVATNVGDASITEARVTPLQHEPGLTTGHTAPH